MNKPTHLLGYYGGKQGPVGAWIAQQLPPHRCYVEPFGGMGGVLMQKRPSPVEVYNELAHELVNLFRVVRDQPDQLREVLALTPYSREEYTRARRGRKTEADPLELARQTYVVRSQSRDNSLLGKGFSHGGAAYPGAVADAFVNGQARIPAVCERLRQVQLENRCALDMLRQWDSPQTLFYLDPPYVHGERTAKAGYAHEMNDAQHLALLASARQLHGLVLLSGYRNELYHAELETCGWLRRDFATVAHSSASRQKRTGTAGRVESLWLNPAAARATASLFDFAQLTQNPTPVAA